MTPARPIMRYHGGKWKLADWIISHFPPHRVYIEPFGGGGSVLMRKPRSYAEVYNDLDREIVNVFRVLREAPEELKRLCYLTPFSRDEFDIAHKPTSDPIESARRVIFRSFAGFASTAVTRNYKTGFRANSNRSGTTPAHDWANYPQNIDAFFERLRGVVIENRDAATVMRNQDSAETLHYVDPPYLHSTRRVQTHRDPAYTHEMTDADHIELSRVLNGLKGMVVLSGYDDPLYREIYSGWMMVQKNVHADGARDRVECLWLNPQAHAQKPHPDMFHGDAA